MTIGGIEIPHAYLLKSTRLEKLVISKEVLINHKIEGSILIRPIQLDRHWNLECYTEKGLRHLKSDVELFINPDRLYESRKQQWLLQGFIKYILFSDIVSVY